MKHSRKCLWLATAMVGLAQAQEPMPTPTQQQPASAAAAAAEAPRTSIKPSSPRAAADRLDLDTTVVTGNRELPKVLYIVPWKKADLGDLPAKPFNTLLDEALTPVDRDVFRREVTYYGVVSEASGTEHGDKALQSSPGRGEPQQ